LRCTYAIVELLEVDVANGLVGGLQLGGQGVQGGVRSGSGQLVRLDVTGGGHVTDALDMHHDDALGQVEGIVDGQAAPVRVAGDGVAQGGVEHIAHVVAFQCIVALETDCLGAIQHREFASGIDWNRKGNFKGLCMKLYSSPLSKILRMHVGDTQKSRVLGVTTPSTRIDEYREYPLLPLSTGSYCNPPFN